MLHLKCKCNTKRARCLVSAASAHSFNPLATALDIAMHCKLNCIEPIGTVLCIEPTHWNALQTKLHWTKQQLCQAVCKVISCHPTIFTHSLLQTKLHWTIDSWVMHWTKMEHYIYIDCIEHQTATHQQLSLKVHNKQCLQIAIWFKHCMQHIICPLQPKKPNFEKLNILIKLHSPHC